MLDEPAREALAERIAERSFGLGPLEPLLADPEVDEILVCGTAPAWVERAGRLEATAARFTTEAELRHAIERILAPLGRRVDEAEPLCDARLPDGSRVNVVVPAARARRTRAHDPPLPPPRLQPRGAGRERHADRAAGRAARAGGAAPLQPARLRRHRLRQDDAAQRPVELHRPRRARGDDRGRGRAAPAPAARPAARVAAAEPRGPRRGDDPPPRPQRAADAPRPHRRRRGPRAGGARHADRALHRPRGLALHRPRRHRRRGAAAPRDARADGRRRPPARRDPRAGRRRDRPRRLPGPRRRRQPPRDRGRRGGARGGRRRRARDLHAARGPPDLARPARRRPRGPAGARRG